MYMHIIVNQDGKVLIRTWNNFLWLIIRKFWKAEAYFIQLKHIVIEKNCFGDELSLLVIESILECGKEQPFQIFV